MFETQAYSSKDVKAQGNLFNCLVQAAKDEQPTTQEEVTGDMFVIDFMGHDTTAHLFAYTFLLPAAHPEV
jgi:cytochrome P450